MPENLLNTLQVPVTKSAALRYLLECVEHGYFHHISGRVAPVKVAGFVAKMAERYAVLASRGARAYARKRGRAAARLVMFPLDGDPDGAKWAYSLLATDGVGAVREQERLLDARKPGQRLAWMSYYDGPGWRPQYELISRPVLSRSRGLIYTWTWQMTPATFEQMKSWVEVGAGRVRSSSDKDPAHLAAAAEALRRMPGFHAVRGAEAGAAEGRQSAARGLDCPQARGYRTLRR